MVRALRLSSRPPKAGSPFPADLAGRLAAATTASLTADTPPDRWATVLDALSSRPVRLGVTPQSVPEKPSDELVAAVRRVADRLPQIAALFGVQATARSAVAPAGRSCRRCRRATPPSGRTGDARPTGPARYRLPPCRPRGRRPKNRRPPPPNKPPSNQRPPNRPHRGRPRGRRPRPSPARPSKPPSSRRPPNRTHRGRPPSSPPKNRCPPPRRATARRSRRRRPASTQETPTVPGDDATLARVPTPVPPRSRPESSRRPPSNRSVDQVVEHVSRSAAPRGRRARHRLRGFQPARTNGQPTAAAHAPVVVGVADEQRPARRSSAERVEHRPELLGSAEGVGEQRHLGVQPSRASSARAGSRVLVRAHRPPVEADRAARPPRGTAGPACRRSGRGSRRPRCPAGAHSSSSTWPNVTVVGGDAERHERRHERGVGVEQGAVEVEHRRSRSRGHGAPSIRRHGGAA